MNEWANFLAAGALAANFAALASNRMPAMIRVVAFQGALLGVLPLLVDQTPGFGVWFVAVSTVAVKGAVIPLALNRALRAARIQREVEPLIGYVPSLLLGAMATIGAFLLAARLPLFAAHTGGLLVPTAFTTVACGFLLLAGRVKAISQVCGYLMLENGVYLFGVLLIDAMPFLVEIGILLDLTVAVFVIGIIVDRIQRAFDSLDPRQLSALKE
jgi:hydrogenase-4 component E